MTDVTNNRTGIIAYRRGSFDAFIAAFIYWKLFKHDAGQTYHSVDPFTSTFIDRVLDSKRPAHVVSIGTNIQTLYRPESKLKNIQLGRMIPFYSYEVSDTFPDMENDMNLGEVYVKLPGWSLTQLILQVLKTCSYLHQQTPEFVIMNQFFGFNSDPKHVIDPRVADQLANTFPNMAPEDFEVLDAMLYKPTQALAYFSKKSVHSVLSDVFTEQVLRANKTETLVPMKEGRFDSFMRFINTSLYTHPLVESIFKHKTETTFVYEITSEGIRGKLIAPTDCPDGFSVLSIFPDTLVSGSNHCCDIMLDLDHGAALLKLASNRIQLK